MVTTTDTHLPFMKPEKTGNLSPFNFKHSYYNVIVGKVVKLPNGELDWKAQIFYVTGTANGKTCTPHEHEFSPWGMPPGIRYKFKRPVASLEQARSEGKCTASGS